MSEIQLDCIFDLDYGSTQITKMPNPSPNSAIHQKAIPDVLTERAAGILLHPTSLPGRDGIGDFGKAAYQFVDFLVSAGMSRWQILPLGPTGYGDSPYSTYSSFAGNSYLISLEMLAEAGWIDSDWYEHYPKFESGRIDFGGVWQWKRPLLQTAARRFLATASRDDLNKFETFCREQSSWLDDYASFTAIKSHFDAQAVREVASNSQWNVYWDKDIARREPEALKRWQRDCWESIQIEKVTQYFFAEQWMALKRYANARGIQIIGDLPIFVAQDSADVWSSPEYFLLDEQGNPRVVAGVPKDGFSPTGQRWGNPLYDWDAMKQDGFRWWVNRFRRMQEMCDIIRVDHFRGFEACWTIPADHTTAEFGEWVTVPGNEMFQEVRRRLGNLPLIAEDLGHITPEVDRLRDENRFPGMKVLQFAFDCEEGACRQYLPHNFIPNCVVYTGTHDNDTTVGWYGALSGKVQARVREYIASEPAEIHWALIRVAMGSCARLCIIPMQDILGLGNEARMNQPSTLGNNWTWRLQAGYTEAGLAQRLEKLARLFDR